MATTSSAQDQEAAAGRDKTASWRFQERRHQAVPRPQAAAGRTPRRLAGIRLTPHGPIPIADGFTGDVITLDAAIDSSFPNGRRVGGGSAPNRNQVNVNSVLISLIVAGDLAVFLRGFDQLRTPLRC